MKYSKHLKGIINSQHSVCMDNRSLKTILNIVALESSIHVLKKSQAKFSELGIPHALDLDVFHLKKQLTEITGNLSEPDLMQRILGE